MRIKNVRNPKRVGRRYLKKLEKIREKGSIDPVILNCHDVCFIVDKKYEKKCIKYLKKYEKSLKGEKTGILKLAICGGLAAAAVAWILSHQNPTLYNNFNYKIEKVLENEDPEKNTEMSQTTIEIEQRLSSAKALERRALEAEIIEPIIQTDYKTDNEIILEWHLQKAIYDSYIRTYAGFFHFDYEKVIKLARTMTNDYEDFSNFLSEEDCDLSNPEAACMQFVYLLYRDKLPINWEEFNFTQEEIVLTNEVTTANYYNDLNELYLYDGLKYSEFMEKYCDMFKINDKNLALSVSIEEIGKKGSRLSKEENNFGGMRFRSGDFMTFPTPEAGIICYLGMFKKNYNEYTLENVESMATIYVGKESPIEERMNWANHVKEFYNEIEDEYDFYFPSNSNPKSEIKDNVPQLTRTRDIAV